MLSEMTDPEQTLRKYQRTHVQATFSHVLRDSDISAFPDLIEAFDSKGVTSTYSSIGCKESSERITPYSVRRTDLQEKGIK